jgi:hypothetical protein
VFGNKKKEILANGIQARAVIMQVKDTGVTINDNPRVELILQVQPEGEAPFQATKKVTVSRVAIPTAGSARWVRYDPADPSRVEFDVEKTEQVNAAAQAAVSVTSAGVTANVEGMQVIDASGIPGLRDQVLKAVSDAQTSGDTSELRDVVMGAIGQSGAMAGGGPTPAATASSDPLDRLKKLNDLRVAGALTDAEFAAEKAKILGEV